MMFQMSALITLHWWGRRIVIDWPLLFNYHAVQTLIYLMEKNTLLMEKILCAICLEILAYSEIE